MAKIKALENAKAYLMVRGVEKSIVDSLDNCFDLTKSIATSELLNPEHKRKAQDTLEQDYEESGFIGIDSLQDRDLVSYLDLGSLLEVLEMHKNDGDAGLNVKEVEALSGSVERYGLLGIRNRVCHTNRPLQPDDVETLESFAKECFGLNDSFEWGNLIQGLEDANALSDSNYVATEIPDYWIKENRIQNNLPSADFLDTGFIGRKKERKNLRLILNRSKVVSVTGEGGTGKTALAIQVCYDILDQEVSEPRYEQIYFWSLKTQALTSTGIKQIRDDIGIDDFVEDLAPDLLGTGPNPDSEPWSEIIEIMKKRRILLVIDNLETIGQEIRDLLVNVPDGSSILMTTRIGFGEIEERYQIPQMSLGDAQYLFRRVVSVYNYESLKKLGNGVVHRYCLDLSFNPLLIRWFVQAVGSGANAATILSHSSDGNWSSREFKEALGYCWENVYDQLSDNSKHVVAILMAARAGLSRAVLQDLANIDQITYDKIRTELDRCSIIDHEVDILREEQMTIKEGVIATWLKMNHPPADWVVDEVRQRLRFQRSVIEEAKSRLNAYRYGRQYLNIKTDNEAFVARDLREALGQIKAGKFEYARGSIDYAREQLPGWSETYRVEAFLFEKQRESVFRVEEAYEAAIQAGCDDIVHWHYAVYLKRHEEYERSIEQLDAALKYPSSDKESIRSLKAFNLMCSGDLDESLKLMEQWWEQRETTFPDIRIKNATQTIELHKRFIERAISNRDTRRILEHLDAGTLVAEQVIETDEVDNKLVEKIVALVCEVNFYRLVGPDDVSAEIVDRIQRFGEVPLFNEKCLNSAAVNRDWSRTSPEFVDRLFPISKESVESPDDSLLSKERELTHSGSIRAMKDNYGFITLDTGGDAFLNRRSLASNRDWELLKEGARVRFDTEESLTGTYPNACHLRLQNTS